MFNHRQHTTGWWGLRWVGVMGKCEIDNQMATISVSVRRYERRGNARLNFSDLARQANVYWIALPSLSTVLEDGEDFWGFYHPDYLEAQELGDDPYRYYRW